MVKDPRNKVALTGPTGLLSTSRSTAFDCVVLNSGLARTCHGPPGRMCNSEPGISQLTALFEVGMLITGGLETKHQRSTVGVLLGIVPFNYGLF